MASNQPPPQPASSPPPFDMQKLFKPSTATAAAATSSAGIYPPPPPSSSYPPPSYPPQNGPLYQQNIPNYSHEFNTQRSLSYPTPPLHPTTPPQNPNAGARLMALLSAPPSAAGQTESAAVQVMPPPVVIGGSGSAPMRMPSSKVPRGRHLSGESLVYDVDVRMQGEVQPQLEVTPITKYNSDPQLVFGRQIAVNKTYICYGLNQGNIRVLNINTALRHLLRGHTQRVTDMAFFAEDVHLLASASVDGRVYVWKISESSEEEDKPQITANIVIALQLLGEGESVHPRVCWHCHKQEILVIGIGKRILRIDTTKTGKGEVYSVEDPLKCSVDKLIGGVQLVGRHDGEVTDLSMCQWMTSRLVSASTDGTIKIWTDRKPQPLAVLRPHEGQPVNCATFLTSPHRPDHIVLITGGPLNREVKVWASEGDEGWPLPSESETWKCMQTLELKSSSEPRVEDAFFNQVVVLPQAGLLLLANAKKNAIYAIHIEYGPYPAATRMDYIAEFTVTMPILSFTGISDILSHGEHLVQVYCVQTQAIQQYALDLTQCLPPPQESAVLEKSDSLVSREATSTEGHAASDQHESRAKEVPIAASGPKPIVPASVPESSSLRYPVGSGNEIASSREIACSNMEIRTVGSGTATNSADIATVASPPPPLSPKLSRKVSDLRSPTNGTEPSPQLGDHSGDQQVVDYSVDSQTDAMRLNFSKESSLDDVSRANEKKVVQDDSSNALNTPTTFKHPTHLITPSEILMANSSSETSNIVEGKSDVEAHIQDVVINSDAGTAEVEVKVVGEASATKNEELNTEVEPQTHASENKERYFCSQASDLSIEMARESSAISAETYGEDARQVDDASSESLARPPSSEDVCDSSNDATGKLSESATSAAFQQSALPGVKGKKQKVKTSQASGPPSPSPSAFNSTDSSNEPGVNPSVTPTELSFSQFHAMQDMLTQILNTQKEMHKQMTMMVAVPVTKEGKRLEATLGRNIEKAIKTSSDALWARFQEESAKNEKLLRDRTQQMTNILTNYVNKDLPSTLEKLVKKEMAATVQNAVRAITPAIEQKVTSAIVESFQRGVGDKAVNQLDKSVNVKLEATVARQIQAQFQTSGKQALQETLKASLEASLIPAFERSCKTMFEQVDAAFQRGMGEHTAAAQQHFEAANSQLAFALRDALNSATSITKTLSGELADGQRKLMSFVASPSGVHPMVSLPLAGLHAKVEAPDPTKELSRLISERKYEEAFTGALQRSDVSIVSWLCSQVDLHGILSIVPPPLSQGVLLSLLQQLACDIKKDISRKLSWMTDVAAAINPTDPMIAMHVHPIFEQVYQILNHQRNLPSITGADASSIRLLMHVINSMLMTCK